RINQVAPGSPAAAAGLAPGDVILAVNDDTERSVADIVNAAHGQPVKVRVERNGQIQEFRLTPRREDGVYRIGVQLGPTRGEYRRPSFGTAVKESLIFPAARTVEIVATIVDMARRKQPAQVSSVIGITVELGRQIKDSTPTALLMIAVLSIFL